MFWKVICEEAGEGQDGCADGRFVLHRHRDEGGAHLDLRLEVDGCLVGWRIDGESLEDGAWATEKGPHPTRWLEADGDAVRVDGGMYAWLEQGADRRTVLLRGDGGARRLCVTRERALPISAVRAVCEALEACGADVGDVGRLIADGATTRRRAVERFCGLGRELDGGAFSEAVWRKALSGLSLDEIHGQLRAYEVRFDAKYPPSPVSRPERLPEEDSAERTGAALAIVREQGE